MLQISSISGRTKHGNVWFYQRSWLRLHYHSERFEKLMFQALALHQSKAVVEQVLLINLNSRFYSFWNNCTVTSFLTFTDQYIYLVLVLALYRSLFSWHISMYWWEPKKPHKLPSYLPACLCLHFPTQKSVLM